MPSWKLAPWPHSKHEKRTAGSAWETWTVATADGVRCARVRWEINFLLTFETAPFFCVYPLYMHTATISTNIHIAILLGYYRANYNTALLGRWHPTVWRFDIRPCYCRMINSDLCWKYMGFMNESTINHIIAQFCYQMVNTLHQNFRMWCGALPCVTFT